MQTLVLLRHRRLFQAIHQTLNTSTSSLKFLCSQTAENLQGQAEEPKKEEPKCLSLRIERLPKGETAGSAFQSWMADGFPVHRGDIFHAINRLRKLKFNKRALEVNFILRN